VAASHANFDGAANALTVRYVNENAAELVGKRVLIDSYVGNICEKLAKKGCRYKKGKRRYVLFGEPVVEAWSADQPCSSSGGPELLLDGHFSPSLGQPEGRRVIVSGILKKKFSTLPQSEGSERRVLLAYEFHYVLENVSIVKKFETKCSFNE